jgi:hypothetical protein
VHNTHQLEWLFKKPMILCVCKDSGDWNSGILLIAMEICTHSLENKSSIVNNGEKEHEETMWMVDLLTILIMVIKYVFSTLSKLSKLHTLYMCSLLYISYVSVKAIKNKKLSCKNTHKTEAGTQRCKIKQDYSNEK